LLSSILAVLFFSPYINQLIGGETGLLKPVKPEKQASADNHDDKLPNKYLRLEGFFGKDIFMD